MKKLICTHTSAHYEVARPIVYPIFKKYAKKVKADFIAVEDTLYNDDPAMDRFRIKHFFKSSASRAGSLERNRLLVV